MARNANNLPGCTQERNFWCLNSVSQQAHQQNVKFLLSQVAISQFYVVIVSLKKMKLGLKEIIIVTVIDHLPHHITQRVNRIIVWKLRS